jgi:hypothetical protein
MRAHGLRSRAGHAEFWPMVILMAIVIVVLRGFVVGIKGADPWPWWAWWLLHPILDLALGMVVLAVIMAIVWLGESEGSKVGLGYGQHGLWPRFLVLFLSLVLTINSASLWVGWSWSAWEALGFWKMLAVTALWLIWAVVVTLFLSRVLPPYDPLEHITSAEHDAIVAGQMGHRRDEFRL